MLRTTAKWTELDYISCEEGVEFRNLTQKRTGKEKAARQRRQNKMTETSQNKWIFYVTVK